jgi:wobble nucleotide-excising tRNase
VLFRSRSTKALEQAVQNVAIERLKSDPPLAGWVEVGLAIHSDRKLSSCEFCGNELSTARLDALSAHFSEADRLLKSELDEILSDAATARSIVSGIVPPDEARLYKQLRPAYAQATSDLSAATSSLSQALSTLAKEVLDKKSRTMEKVTISTALDAAKVLAAIEQVNGILEKHNELSDNLQTNQATALSQIEKHHLSTVYDDVNSFRSGISTQIQAIGVLENGNPAKAGDLGISALESRIAQSMAKISSAHRSCETLNVSLRDYFGRDELYFEVKNDAKGQPLGYVLRRQNEIAKNISEGERTAIAFAHFCTHLHSKDFSMKNGIVVIDDPISSLDSALLFRVCAAIKKQTKGASQLFVLTHNMEFFNQVKNWFRNDPAIIGEDKSNPNYRILMIESRFDAANARRVAMITDIDPLLRDYESEYHYLFKKLHSFDTDWPPENNLPLRAIYDYPNLARKLLECFLAFRVPIRGTMYVRLLGLKDVNPAISSETLESVYNFVNSHSHLDTKTGLLQFDATLGVSGRDAIARTLSLIEQADAPHYKAMIKAISKK